jgi:hypothetical protein
LTETDLGTFLPNDIPDPTYDRPSSLAKALIYQAAYGGEIINAPSPCGENCSFTQSFVGPAYKCEEKDPYDPLSPWCKLAATYWEAPSCQEMRLWPAYSAGNATDEDFCAKYLQGADCGLFWGYDPNTGDVRDEWMSGTIWILYTYLPEEYRNDDQYIYQFSEVWQNYSYRCEQWEAQYDIRRTWVNSKQTIDSYYT